MLIVNVKSFTLSPCEEGYFCSYEYVDGKLKPLEKYKLSEAFFVEDFEEDKERLAKSLDLFCNPEMTSCSVNEDTVLERGVYNLVDGLYVSKDGVTLDCNYSTFIGGWGVGNGDSGVDIFKNNVVIKNCIFKEYGNGILISGHNNTVINCNSSNNGANGIFISGDNNSIMNNNLFENNDSGIYITDFVVSSAWNNSFIGNELYDNRNGITIRKAGEEIQLISNRICDSIEPDIYLESEEIDYYGEGNYCNDPGRMLWRWDDNETFGCSQSCESAGCDKFEPANKKGFGLISEEDDNWRVDFLGWVKDSRYSEYAFNPWFEIPDMESGKNSSYESIVEYELDVPPGKDKLTISYSYFFHKHVYNTVNFSMDISIYDFENEKWNKVYTENSQEDFVDDFVDIVLYPRRIEDNKIRLRVSHKNQDINGSSGVWYQECRGEECWHATIVLERFTYQFCTSHCANGVKDGDEDGIDCGGSCELCISCYNGLLDGDEDGIDCGGSCPFVCGNCKPLIYQGAHEDKIDVVFVPDQTYNGDMELFKKHIDQLINGSYKQSPPIRDNLNKFNFYYIEDESWTNWSGGGHNLPESLKTECSFYDAAAIIHTDSHRDFRSGKKLSSEYDSNGTFVHESGHAIFNVADEYCCDSRYWKPSPFPNIYPNESDCRQDATNEGWNPNDCNFFCDPNDTSGGENHCGEGWWRSDPDPDIMRNSGGGSVNPFQRADLRNIYWTFDQYPNETIRTLSSIQEDKKVIILDLYFENNSVNLSEAKIIYNGAPDYVGDNGDLSFKIIKNSSLVREIKMWDPRLIVTEEQAFYLDEGNMSVSFEIQLDEEFIDIYNKTNDLIFSINLSRYFNDFCLFRDGKCDTDCKRGDIDWPDGDADLNKKVDIFDLARVGLCYNQEAIGYCEIADLNQDERINIFDLARVGLDYGNKC